MVEISRRDYLAGAAAISVSGVASRTAEASPDETEDDEDEPTIPHPNSTLAVSSSAAITLKRINWDEVPEISAEEGEWFRQRLLEAPIEPEGGPGE